MGDPMEVTPSSVPLDLESIRSEVRDLMETHGTCDEYLSKIVPSCSEELLKDCAIHLESKVKEMISECSDVSLLLGIDDLDAYMEHLKEELKTVEAESIKISNEIETLTRTNFEDSNRLESDLEELNCSLDLITSQGLEKAKVDPHIDCSTYGEGQSNSINTPKDHNFEILKLESEIEKNKIVLTSLQDLDSTFKWFDAVEQIEDSLTGLKVIEFDGNVFRLSLQTYIPKVEGLSFQQNIEDVAEPSEVNHELLIEMIDGTMELKKVEIFPNDVYIGDIVDAAKSFRPLASTSALQWFIGEVQNRIILNTLRLFAVKSANQSRHFFEYVDKDEMVVAHLVGGVDVFIKLSQGWPLLNCTLKFSSLKTSSHLAKGISLKVEEGANSLDVQIRQNLISFIDAVEKIVVEQTCLERLHPDDTPGPGK